MIGRRWGVAAGQAGSHGPWRTRTLVIDAAVPATIPATRPVRSREHPSYQHRMFDVLLYGLFWRASIRTLLASVASSRACEVTEVKAAVTGLTMTAAPTGPLQGR